jgi:phosphoribosylformylglycinamidine cyclo-ligase
MTLARRALFDAAGFSVDRVLPELGVALGEELLRPTPIYVPEVLDIIRTVPSVKALINITGDGLLNLTRVLAPVGFVIDDLPPPLPIFGLIQKCGEVGMAEMFAVYNMGVGFCILAAAADADAILAVLARHGRRARIIGHVVADPDKRVRIPQHQLVGRGKQFRRE